jgi:hypothetical protein
MIAPAAPARRRPVAESLEPRLLYSADPLPVDGWVADMPEAEVRLIEPIETAQATETSARVLIFIDASLDDAQALAEAAVRDAPGAQVVWLGAGGDAIDQIGTALAGRQDIDAIHLLSHGSDGGIRIGEQTIDRATLEARADDIARWQAALGSDADLLLYGCDVAGSEAGQWFARRLAELTGADVAASDDLTGAGGDWSLEFSVGRIEQAALAPTGWAGTLAVSAQGGDINVNTTAEENQWDADVAVFDDGGWVAVWTDADTGNIHMRLFDANGDAIAGSQDRVNQRTAGTATNAQVATDGSSQFAVVFTSTRDGTRDIYVRLFALDGTSISGDILVNSGMQSGDQDLASIAMNDAGQFVVAWEGSGSADSDGVYARRFNGDGSAASGVLAVNESTSGSQSEVGVAIGGDGRFAVTWLDDGVGKRIMARLYDATGTPGSEFEVSPDTSAGKHDPAIAMAEGGQFAIVWDQHTSDTNTDDIWLRRYDSAGVALGDPQRVNTTLAKDQYEADIAMTRDGHLVVTWTDKEFDGSGRGVYMQAYLDGVADGGQVRVNAYTNNDQRRPAIDVNDNGQIVVVWDGARSGGENLDVSARRFDWPEGVHVNLAPVLDPLATPVLAPVLEDAGAPSGPVGTLIGSLVSRSGSGSGPGNVTDADPGDGTGLALVAADTSLGSWYYSINDGSSWIAIDAAALGEANALLLAADGKTRLYFKPDANQNGSVIEAIKFRAWDGNSGANGGFADTRVNGGSTAFSAQTDTAVLSVTPVNDIPQIDTNTLTITEGGNVQLGPGMLLASDVETSAAADLQFEVRSVSGGHFALAGDLGTAVTIFTQQQVNDGQVHFVHDGNEAAPAYTLRVSDPDGGVSSEVAATVTFTNVNDAPVLADRSLTFTAQQGNANPVGAVGLPVTLGVSLAGSGVGPENVTDPDIGAIAGMIITAADESQGNWYYSIDGGATWASLMGGLGAGEGRLLLADGNTRVYFDDTSGNAGTFADALTFHAWDGTIGSNGGGAVVSGDAFSTASDTVALLIVATNNAPVLDTGISVTVNSREDAPAPSGAVGFTMDALVSLSGSGAGPLNVTDDSGALTGIALTGLNTPNGRWWFSTDGGANWSEITSAPSVTDALLLASDGATRLYYQPTVANDFGLITGALEFKAWDQTFGANGTRTDTSTANTFSSQTSSAALDVQSVNDLPSLDTNHFAITEGAQLVLSNANLAASDVESSADALTYTISDLSGGHFALAASPGTPIGSFTQAQVAAGDIVFVHDGGEAAPAFRIALGDGTDTLAPVDAVIDFTPVNDRPVLTASDSATLSLDEDAGVPVGVVGAPVSALVSLAGSGAGPQNVVDADAGGLTGIAIILADATHGTWYYTLDDGANWQAFSGVSSSNALLLGSQSGTRLAFAPNAEYSGTTPAALRFVAWDQSSGAAGDRVDTGAGTAFSTASDSLTLIVRPVDDAPVVPAVDLGSIAEDGSRLITQAELLASASDADGDPLTVTRLVLASGSGNLTDHGDGTWTFTPTANWSGAVSFDFEVEDASNQVSATASLTVDAVNDTPVVTPIDLGTVTEDSPRLITQAELLAGASDADGDTLTVRNLTVTSGSGSLTDLGGGTWRYTPALDENGSPRFAFEVWDGTVAVANTAGFDILAVNDTPDIAVNQLTLREGEQRVLTSADLLGTDPESAADALTYTVTALAQGQFVRVGAPDTPISSFTQAQVNAGQIAFRHDGGEAAPGYTLVLSDGSLSSPPSSANIAFTNVNDAPTLSGFADQRIVAGSSFGPQGFTVGDVESAADSLSVAVSSSVPQVVPASAFALGGSGTDRVLQFVGSGSVQPGTTVITVSVSDGGAVTSRSFTITVAGAPDEPEPPATPVAPPPADTPEGADAAPAPTPASPPPVVAAPAPAPAPAPPPEQALGELATLAPVEVPAPSPSEPVDERTDAQVESTPVGLSATELLALYFAQSGTEAGTGSGSLGGGSGGDAAMEQAFDQMRQAADDDQQSAQATVGVAMVSGAGLTIGYVAWLIRGGVLVSSLLSTMPAWRLLDPLPIIGNSRNDAHADDDSLESMVARSEPAPKPAPEPAGEAR